MKTSTRLLLGMVFGGCILLAIANWTEVVFHLGMATQASVSWTQEHPLLAALAAAYLTVSGIIGFLASKSGRWVLFGIMLTVTGGLMALAPVRNLFNLSTLGMVAMVASAMAVAVVVFFLRETGEHDWFSNARARA